MKTQQTVLNLLFLLGLVILFSSCRYEEDPGPLQEMEKQYSILDFDRLEIGSAMVISVQQGALYSVHVKGDRRNIDDLEVEKIGTTLRARYRTNEYRQHETYITITMPSLLGVNFSGASVSAVTGFKDVTDLDAIISGASVAQFNMQVAHMHLNLSGASKLTLAGGASKVDAIVSGASVFSGYSFPVEEANVDVSGASKMTIQATAKLVANASGASVILYKGGAQVSSTVSGASTIRED